MFKKKNVNADNDKKKYTILAWNLILQQNTIFHIYKTQMIISTINSHCCNEKWIRW